MHEMCFSRGCSESALPSPHLAVHPPPPLGHFAAFCDRGTHGSSILTVVSVFPCVSALGDFLALVSVGLVLFGRKIPWVFLSFAVVNGLVLTT